jgi:hypothetical protein
MECLPAGVGVYKGTFDPYNIAAVKIIASRNADTLEGRGGGCERFTSRRLVYVT